MFDNTKTTLINFCITITILNSNFCAVSINITLKHTRQRCNKACISVVLTVIDTDIKAIH
jgi:hypothetical protein